MNALKIGFLGYSPSETTLVGFLKDRGHVVTCIETPVSDLSSFDRVVSFGYRHILRKPVLDTAKLPVLNLHMSLLPFNRGAHPNFWAWADGTPHGVTIHEMTAGLDEGPIVAQRVISFENNNISFSESYKVLFDAMETLFRDQIDVVETGNWAATPQEGAGTYHTTKHLPEWVTSWDLPAHLVHKDHSK